MSEERVNIHNNNKQNQLGSKNKFINNIAGLDNFISRDTITLKGTVHVKLTKNFDRTLGQKFKPMCAPIWLTMQNFVFSNLNRILILDQFF